MDTKWKRNRGRLGVLCLVLGVYLGIMGFTWLGSQLSLEGYDWRKISQEWKEMLSNDYQDGVAFRDYVGGQLEVFLTAAVGGDLENRCLVYTNATVTYRSSGTVLGDIVSGYAQAVPEAISEEVPASAPDESIDEPPDEPIDEPTDEPIGEPTDEPVQEPVDEPIVDRGMDNTVRVEFSSELSQGQEDWLGRDDWEEVMEQMDLDSEEEEMYRKKRAQLEEQRLAAIEEYFASIEEDGNLLYVISYQGKTCYANTDLLSFPNGGEALPEGYNFLLSFDGTKVTITKDGQALDVYGDGYYTEGQDWLVPGYSNVSVGEEYKDVRVLMAIAEEPRVYTQGNIASSGYQALPSVLYWLKKNTLSFRWEERKGLGLVVAGVVLLLISFLLRRGQRGLRQGVARLTGRIWLECKLALLFLWVIPLIIYFMENAYPVYYSYFSQGYGVRLTYYTYNNDAMTYGFWYATLFCFFALLANDVFYNRKNLLHCSLTAMLWRFSLSRKKLQPLSKRMIRYNVYLCALLGLSALSLGWSLWRLGAARSAYPIVCVLGLFAAPGVFYVVHKSMDAARDLDLLARRVAEVKAGNYAPEGGTPAGTGKPAKVDRDLAPILADIEEIRQGMAGAIEEQMKSERMKVELIANVSHDLKTPLTSIISYVQLLKQEEGLPEAARDYVKILEQKSERLKNMVQDVFVISKAASGELPVNKEVLDFGKLLQQTMADMEEEIAASPVTFRASLPKEPVLIRADGQRMYRVFQNLFQNAIRYSLEGSRVHITLSQEGSLAVASIKNTSKMELDPDVNYAERFIRGDESRTDGGSGLGLSIAQSFTEACGGRFNLEIIADLFVVTISFPMAK